MRRFTKLTNGFSKKLQNHEPHPWSMEDVARLIERREDIRSGAALIG
jgi:hypothetical protein